MAYKFKTSSFSIVVNTGLKSSVYEPIPRIKDIRRRGRGFRNMTVTPSYIMHRFPIKGGITYLDILKEQISQTNTLMAKFLENK